MQVCYFASDFHLGAPTKEQSKERELAIVRWLDYAAIDATDIYLVGDVFDFWFEYAAVIPKGFSRFFGKLAELADRGIHLHFFHGNHDMWVKHYFTEEFGMKIYENPIGLTLYGKRIYLGHGDGLGPGDRGYKLIKSFLRSKVCQWAFARIHPNFGIGLARFFSGKSREGSEHEHQFLGFEHEWLYQFAQGMQQKDRYDYYIFGHRHLPYALPIEQGTYFNLGEWLHYQTFMKIDSEIPQYYTWDGHSAQTYDPPYGKGA
jgi:UDP-2,3-diacylglucosamine hydrolase